MAQMAGGAITQKDLEMAQVCVNCTLCKHARGTQKGPGYWFVRTVEVRVCPFCKAYERVYGRKAHEKRG